MERKTLCVVIPNYNASSYLAMQLEAICLQSFPPDQVIVVDDGSTDDSIEVIQRLSQRFPNIQLVKNGENKGVIYSINRGAGQASGDYIYFSSSNDLVLPGLFEKSMNLLAKYPDAGLCCADVVIRDEVKHVEFDHLPTNWLPHSGYLSPQLLAETTATRKGLYAPVSNTCIIKRNLLPAGDIYHSALECYCDWFAYQTIAFRHGLCFIPEKLVCVRVLPQSYSQSVLDDNERIRQVLMESIALLCTQQYEDVAAFFIKGRSLLVFRTFIRSPLTAWKAVSKIAGSNNIARALFFHITYEYLRQICVRAGKLLMLRKN